MYQLDLLEQTEVPLVVAHESFVLDEVATQLDELIGRLLLLVGVIRYTCDRLEAALAYDQVDSPRRLIDYTLDGQLYSGRIRRRLLEHLLDLEQSRFGEISHSFFRYSLCIKSLLLRV